MARERAIIDNTIEAMDEFSAFTYGSDLIELGMNEVRALFEGKCVAFRDNEYTTFIRLKDTLAVRSLKKPGRKSRRG